MILSFPPRRTVLTYGCFDILNQQHIKFLRQLSAMGDELIVGCTMDGLAEIEDHPCFQSFEARREMLSSCRYVSRVIAEETPGQKYTDIVNYNVSLFVMGIDWAGKFDHLRDVTQVSYIANYSDHDHMLGIRTEIIA